MKKKKKIVITILILVILILAVGLTTMILMNGRNTEKSEKSNKKVDVKVKASKYQMSGNSLEDFDLAFMQFENNKENIVYSPLSIKYALAMLNEGTSGRSKKQITSVIGDYKGKKYVNSANMSLANSLFIRDTYKDQIKEKYINKIKNKYDAEVIYDSFKTTDNVNKWISDKTLNLINNLINDIPEEENFILINALAIDMDWNEKFLIHPGIGVFTSYEHEKFSWNGASKVKSLKFNNDQEVAGMDIIASFNRYDIVKELGEDNIRKTVGDKYREFLLSDEGKQYLDGDESETNITDKVNSYLDTYIEEINSNYEKEDKTTEFAFYTDENIKAFSKDLKEYNGTTLQYVAIMPIKEELSNYVKNINSKKINQVISNLKELKLENFKDGVVTKITGVIPKFKFEYDLDLIKDLKSLGIDDVFNQETADLSNLSKQAGVYIGDVKHKANIEFTQDGIKASAATVLGGLGAARPFDYLYDVPVEEIDMTFDKPYMFIIRDKQTGEVWFAGNVYNPLEWSQDPDYSISY